MKYSQILLLILTLAAIVFTQSKSAQNSAEAAIRVAQNEVDANPNSAEANFELGEAYLAHYYSDAYKAAEAFEKAIRLNPKYADAYYKLALAYDKDHRHHFQEIHPKKEVKALQRAIELKPDYAEAYVQLARTYMANPTLPNLNLEKTYKPAVQLLNKAIGFKPDLAEAYEELARAYAVLRDEQKAKEVSKKLEELKGKNQQ